MFIPTTKSEILSLGWDSLDVVLITGDVYIDSPFDGTAVVGKWLLRNGFKVGVISQPDMQSPIDITRLGCPSLFWGVSGGCVDSMVANYTATKKRRKLDDLTPGGENNRRPDRAVLKYVNLIKQYCKNSKPIVIGGIEASLRRVAHYDYWDESLRRSILFDSKADYLLYGMSEKSILELAIAFKNDSDVRNINGLCYISKEPVNDFIELPSYDDVKSSHSEFEKMFDIFYKNTDPLIAKGLYQKTGDRYLIQNPPSAYPLQEELDKYYEMDYEYDAHPYYKSQGKIVALDTIKQSITSHRGCFGECNFCAIAVHQGRKIISRSKESILNEVQSISKRKNFNGIIYDVGGPSANMFEMTCKKQDKHGSCTNKRCIFPKVCEGMNINHNKYIDLLNSVKQVKGVERVFVSSGLRYDLIMEDKKSGLKFISELAEKYVSGQLKIAPEHISKTTLQAMGKSIEKDYLVEFKNIFLEFSKKFNKKQFLTYYFIAAHPGCTINDMKELKQFLKYGLKTNPEQVQVFTPTPSTYSALMYYTGRDPISKKPVYVEKTTDRKQIQKEIIVSKKVQRHRRIK